ncbi:MAG: OmpA family protein [Pseudomonadota bacterium]|nr:OmpA family protein [Pseudomonadota bacterium]
MNTKLLPLVAVIALAATSSVQAHSSVEAKGDIMAEGTSAYVVDSWGRIVRDNENRCVRSIDWSKDTAIAKCEGWEEPKPAPVVVPAPAPAPVVAAPAPTPAPMAPAKFIGHFDFDKADVKEIPELDVFAAYMNEVADSKVSITGHTDSSGPESYNQALSVKRAQDVADYLAGKGIAADRMTVSGMGESSPIADNATKAGRAENRRVEVEIVK